MMTSREAIQTYTGIDMPGERWCQLHVHCFQIEVSIYTYTHLNIIFDYNYSDYYIKIVII